MSAAEALVEQALLDLLAADAGVQAALGDPIRVKTGDADRPAYPFLEIAAHQSRTTDVAGFAGGEHIIDLAVTSFNDKGQGGLAGLGAVRAALRDARLSMDGWRDVLITPIFADILRAAPGLWRAILRLRIVIEEA